MGGVDIGCYPALSSGMGRMIFDLTDEDREALEAIRKNRGHRSHAETLRTLIRQAASSGLPTPERRAEMKAAVRERQSAVGRRDTYPDWMRKK